MIPVRTTLTTHLEASYFRVTRSAKAHGADVSREEAIEDDLLQFLEAIPAAFMVEEEQYARIQQWIDRGIREERSFSRHLEIAILTYINSCGCTH